MELFARHGDLVIDRREVTGELAKARDVVFAGDSSGHTHVLVGPCLMRREGRVTFVRLAKSTRLEHRKAGGHVTITMPKGDYIVGPLRERGDATDRPVED